MKCPRCGFENQDDVRFCSQCGLSRENPNVNTAKVPAKKTEELNYNIPMNFHMFYSIVMMIVAIMGLLSALVCLFIEDYMMVSFVTFVPAAVLLATSILLLMRNKVGNVMRLVLNIYQIVKNAILLITMLICGFVFAIVVFALLATGEAEAAIAAFIVIFVVLAFMTIYVIGNIIIDALIINYYHKRKHMFH